MAHQATKHGGVHKICSRKGLRLPHLAKMHLNNIPQSGYVRFTYTDKNNQLKPLQDMIGCLLLNRTKQQPAFSLRRLQN